MNIVDLVIDDSGLNGDFLFLIREASRHAAYELRLFVATFMMLLNYPVDYFSVRHCSALASNETSKVNVIYFLLYL